MATNAEQLIEQARGYIARTWTGQPWRAEQSLNHPGYWDVWTMDATGQRRIILARFLTANTAALLCFVSTGLTQLCDLANPVQSRSPKKLTEHSGHDARAVCDALGFDPTNHHNALRCPYCNPEGLQFPNQQEEGER